MTPICTEHAALLRSVAKNLNDRAPILAYSDWLQENSNPGYLIVANYPPVQWPVWIGNSPRTKCLPSWGNNGESWKLPWLEGVYWNTNRISNPKSRIKKILTAYTEGQVIS